MTRNRTVLKKPKNIPGILYIILFIICSSCVYDLPIEIDISNKKIETPFEYEILKNSRQIIMTQEFPWESQALLYYNVIKKDSTWHMWYMSVGKEIYNGYFGALNYAYSKDGEYWVKTLLDNQPIVEQFVNYDINENKYRMIGVNYIDESYSTNVLESIDGINWFNEKRLFDKSYDTQFSVITRNEKHFIYQREWYKGLRVIGRSVIDKNLNVVESPKVMLLSNDTSFPHIYNNAASKVGSNILLFPTLYNDTDNFKISIGFEFDNQLHLTDADITNDLFIGENIKWGIVSPGLIPTDERDTYWLYYYGNSSSHNFVRVDPKNVAKYYRIKIRITSKR